MPVTWGDDETGILVIAAVADASKKPDKKAKPKADKVARAARGTLPPAPRALPGMPHTAAARAAPTSLLADRPPPPNPLLPLGAMQRAAATDTMPRERPFGAAIAMRHARQSSAFGKGFAITFVALVIAGAGFAIGAFTVLGTEAETIVLGPAPAAPAVAPAAVDPRAAVLQSQLDQVTAELAAQHRANAELRASLPAVLPSDRLELATTWRGPVRTALPQKKHKKKKSKRTRLDAIDL